MARLSGYSKRPWHTGGRAGDTGLAIAMQSASTQVPKPPLFTAASPPDSNDYFDAQQELLLASHEVGNNLRQCDLTVADIRCGGCINNIEQHLKCLDHVSGARVNLSSKLVTVSWDSRQDPPPILQKLRALGYTPQTRITPDSNHDDTLSSLIRALAVAAFAAGNIMLLSVSVWSGAEEQTKHLFHSLSAMIALPAVAYAGQSFFESAWRSLRHGATNMDVPISIGILLALGLSCYDTFWLQSTEAVYFEAPVMLVFFLLIGRALDHLMRDKARKAVNGLARLQPQGAWVCNNNNNSANFKPLASVNPGDKLRIEPGDIIAVDCRVEQGTSDVDCALVTGESAPQPVAVTDKLLAGTRNLTHRLYATATASANESHLAQMITLIHSIENTRSRGRRLADRVSSLYAPVVHLAAALSFIAWYWLTTDVHQSITIAIAVLIITCPCALGLAVPMVQVVIARQLFESGILVKEGSALERLARIDTVVFDKTGTLTTGEPTLVNKTTIDSCAFEIAASMARTSSHPYSRALVLAYYAQGHTELPAMPDKVMEHPGYGIELTDGQNCYRLGRATWAKTPAVNTIANTLDLSLGVESRSALSTSILTRNGSQIAEFHYQDSPRGEASTTIASLRQRGLDIHCLSGDNTQAVATCAAQLNIVTYQAELLPHEKVSYINKLTKNGKRVLMIGDGLNDAPALAAAHVSMAPGAACEVGRNSADIVFTRNNLQAVPQALALARTADQSIKQNLTIALLYNALALPVAVAGLVTPLIAAVAMSASSIAVMANALRLNRWRSPAGAAVTEQPPKPLTAKSNHYA